MKRVNRSMLEVSESMFFNNCKTNIVNVVLSTNLSMSKGTLEYSCLRNFLDRGGWQATQSMGSQKSQT